MKFLSFVIILNFLFFLTKNQKPQNITLYNADCDRDCSYEYKILKGEIFGFEFTRGRGTCCEWELLNRTIFNEYHNIQYLNSYYYDYISEEYEKEKQKAEEEKRKREENENGTGETIYPIIDNDPHPVAGGDMFYYETFEALHETNNPITLKYIYMCCGSEDIYKNVSIDIMICNEINKDKCINKKNCSEEIESPSKENCENLITSNEESKCIFDENNNKCVEKKICSLIVNEPEINCDKAETLEPKTKCIYDKELKKCVEKNKVCAEIIEGANDILCASVQIENGVCLYDEEQKKCIEKYKCLSALNINEEKDCSSLSTSDDVRLKCILKIEGENKSCIEEEKKCLEITNGATEEICEKSKTTNENSKCLFDDITNFCDEIIKVNGGKSYNLSFVLLLIYLIFLGF